MNEQKPEQNIDADQVVVNNAPDGGGVDNNEGDAAPAEKPDTNGDDAQQDTGALQE